ncbi:MAG: glycosyltransferase [Caldilinea sp. CFX5]|nr:glycosyltransferase [Caldilinea sp. CFX5]
MNQINSKTLPLGPPDKADWPWIVAAGQSCKSAATDSHWPRITVVTPSYNQGQYIEETIRSVLLQGYPNLEYIIIDGGSTDNTVDIIHRYKTWLSYCVSEPDRGQAHAINKGWAKSTGEILAWLNSDDLYAPDALFKVAAAYRNHPDEIIAGSVLNFQTRITKATATIEQKNLTWQRFLKFWEGHQPWHQPGIFFPRAAWQQVGPLDDSFYYCMDRDFMVRILQHSSVTYLEDALAFFRVHSTAKTVRMHEEAFIEEKVRIVEKYMHLLPEADKKSLVHFWTHMAGRYLLHCKIKSAIHAVTTAAKLNNRLALQNIFNYSWHLPKLLMRFC